MLHFWHCMHMGWDAYMLGRCVCVLIYLSVLLILFVWDDRSISVCVLKLFLYYIITYDSLSNINLFRINGIWPYLLDDLPDVGQISDVSRQMSKYSLPGTNSIFLVHIWQIIFVKYKVFGLSLMDCYIYSLPLKSHGE